jgi:hypothetical protein
MIWLIPTTFTPLSQLGRQHTGRLRKRDNLLMEEGGGGGGGASSYDDEKAWSSLLIWKQIRTVTLASKLTLTVTHWH